MLRKKWLFVLGAFVTVAGSSAFGQQKTVTTADLTTSTVIEKTASTILAHNTAGAAATGRDFVNPKVQPGKVHWHASFESACKAAKKSGKPVLLFQMMGKLDDQFC